jgi:hypothetical protein
MFRLLLDTDIKNEFQKGTLENDCSESCRLVEASFMAFSACCCYHRYIGYNGTELSYFKGRRLTVTRIFGVASKRSAISLAICLASVMVVTLCFLHRARAGSSLSLPILVSVTGFLVKQSLSCQQQKSITMKELLPQ